MVSELQRVEERLIEVIVLLQKILMQQEEIIELLSPPTFPQSTGGTITVK